MSLARVFTRACVGIDAPLVRVEVHLGGGLPRTAMVGMPETAVREAKDRVKAALLNAGFAFPQVCITIALSPAALPKEGGGFDLPIALGILAASGQVAGDRLTDTEFVGELNIAGELEPVRGVLPMALTVANAGRGLVVPGGNAQEAALAGGNNVLSASSLLEVVAWLNGRCELPDARCPDLPADRPTRDLRDVIGQAQARRALEVAAAGAHNLLFYGSPGTGKTMLASRLPGILPPMETNEALEAASVASISRNGFDSSDWKVRPFRAPHHTASAVALVGGGTRPRPGEISLAHQGVLFLDELPEFNRHVLEVLREPMESGRVCISRALMQSVFPARFQLIAAMNPCPCGFHGDRQAQCTCTGEQVSRYRGKISGPLLDRVDLFVEVSRPRQVILPGKGKPGESSDGVRKRVVSARRVQTQRQGVANALLDSPGIRDHCLLSADDEDFFIEAAQKLNLSPRGCQRVLKVARTIADLDDAGRIGQNHLAEAVGFRQRGRN